MQSILALCLSLCLASPSFAWFPHGAPSGSVGAIVVNIPDTGIGLMFANFFKDTTTNDWSATTNTPAMFTDGGYPNGTPLAAAYAINPTLPVISNTATMVIDWTGSIPANGLAFIAPINATSCTSSAGSGCGTNCITSGGNGSGNTVFGAAGLNGTNCRVEFTFVNATTGAISSPNIYFSTGLAINISSIRLFRKADETNNGGVLPLWNPDFIAAMKQTNAKVLRFMGDIVNAGNEGILLNPQSWTLRAPLTALTYAGHQFPSSQISVGSFTLSGSNFVASGSYPNQPTNWTDKETFQGTFPSPGTINQTVTSVTNNPSTNVIRLVVPSTAGLTTGQVISYEGYGGSGGPGTGMGQWTITVVDSTDIDLTTSYPSGKPSVYTTYSSSPGYYTTATVQLGSRTPKLLISPFGGPPGLYNTNNLKAGIGTMAYDAQFDAVIYTAGGLDVGISPELMVNLCNTLNKDCWINFSGLTSDAAVISTAQYVSANLNSSLNAYLEFSNEPWNGSFVQSVFLDEKGIQLGLQSNPTSFNAETGISYYGLRAAQIGKLFLANWTGQASRVKLVLNVQAAGAQSVYQPYELNGTLLSPASNSILCTYLGGTYTTSCAGATDYSTFPNRPMDVARTIVTAPYMGAKYSDTGVLADAQTYQTNPSSALASFDSIMENSWINKSSEFSTWETVAASYDGARPSGYGPVEVSMYEGGPDVMAASVSEYTSLGVTSSGTVTFNLNQTGQSTPAVTQTGQPYINGSKVNFSGGTLPSGISATQDYFVMDASTNGYDVSATYYNQTPITLTGSPSGTTTATGSTTSIDNLMEAWKNSSYAATWMVNYNAYFLSHTHSRYMAVLQLSGDYINLVLDNSGTTNAANRWAIWQGPLENSTGYGYLTGVQALPAH